MSRCQTWLLTLLFMQCAIRLLACPSSCKCMWKGGKQTVECINEKLISIPDGVDPGTQVLEFSDNNLQVLPRERFQRIGLLNLQRIYLSRCRISQIDDRAFKGLSNLVELDLSHNLLNSVPSETFEDYPSLMRLTFNGNPIQRVKADAFKSLVFLTTLELSNCQIEVIEPDGFKGLVNLEWLKLDGNRLSNIQGPKTLPETLHSIFLHHNPWQCDCRLMDVYFWLINYNVPHPMEPKCAAPSRIQGRTIKSLELDELACLPDVSPTTLYLEIAEGKNVSLLCKVSAVPEARVSWWFQGRILQNDSLVAPGIHLYYFVEEGSEEKKSELFIFNTNTEDNGTFVCMAENPAGKAHSNYTIRIVMKEVPVVNTTALPYEYVVTVWAACSVAALLVAVCGILCAMRCQRSRLRRRKKERSKAMTLQHQQLPLAKADGAASEITRLATDCTLGRSNARGDAGADAGDGVARSGGAGERRGRDATVDTGGAGAGRGVDVERAGCASDAYSSPPSLRGYPFDRNPDLINDTESMGKERRLAGKRVEGDGGTAERDHSANNSYQEAMENIIHDYDPHGPMYGSMSPAQWTDGQVYPLMVTTLPRGPSAEPFQHHHTADVHLSPGRFLDSDGYPIDYGLPKLPTLLPLSSTLAGDHTAVFYRTLPHNRPSRLMTAAPLPVVAHARFPREAEMLPHPAPPPVTFERFSPSDVRYTVEGYPCSQMQNNSGYTGGSHTSLFDVAYLPSPPAAYKGEPTVSPPTAANASTATDEEVVAGAWPHLGARAAGSGDDAAGAAQCCAEALPAPTEAAAAAGVGAATAVTDSPDEGYSGDAAEGAM